jgi:hypothetical protein
MVQYFDDEQDLEQSLNSALESLENDDPALHASENTHGADDIDILLSGPFGVFQSEVSLLLASHETDTPQPASAEADSVFDERGQITLGGVDGVSSDTGHVLSPLTTHTPTCIVPREVLGSAITNNAQPSSSQSEVWDGPVLTRGEEQFFCVHKLTRLSETLLD